MTVFRDLWRNQLWQWQCQLWQWKDVVNQCLDKTWYRPCLWRQTQNESVHGCFAVVIRHRGEFFFSLFLFFNRQDHFFFIFLNCRKAPPPPPSPSPINRTCDACLPGDFFNVVQLVPVLAVKIHQISFTCMKTCSYLTDYIYIYINLAGNTASCEG